MYIFMMHKIKTTKIDFLKSDNLKGTWYAIVYTSNILLVIAINCLAQCSSYLLFTICPTITSGLNRTLAYAAALIKQCLIQKIRAGFHWVELIWY